MKDKELNQLSYRERDSNISVLRNNKKANIAPKNSLSEEENYGLKLLAFTMENKGTLTKDELGFLQDFLVKNMGNMNLNKRLSFLIENSIESLPGDNVGVYMKQFTYATQNIAEISPALDKLTDNVDSLNDKVIKDKLSVSEYGVLNRSRNILSIIMSMDNKNPKIFERDDLKAFKSKIETVNLALGKLENQISQELKFETGDLMFREPERMAQIRGDTLADVEKFIKKHITKYGHVGKIIVKDEEGQREYNQSHVDNGYQFGKVNIKSYLYSDVLKMDVTKLLSAEAIAKLDKESPNWRAEIKAEYDEIEQNIHEDSKREESFSKMSVDDKKMDSAAYSELFSVSKTKKAREDFTKIRDKMLQGEYKDGKVMLCSSFVARETVAALVELNDKIKEKYGIENAVDFPFDKNIKLGKILPGRLYDILVQKGAFQELPRTPTEQRVFQFASKDKEMVQIKSPQDELMNIVNNEIAIYKKNKNLDALKVSLIEKVSEFVTKGENPRAIVIDENSLNFVTRHVEELAIHVDKENSKSFVQKWVGKVVDFVKGRKKSVAEQNIEGEAIKITKRLEDLVENNPANIPVIRAEDAINKSKVLLKEMKKYDLLDNLADYKKIESLNDQDLRDLYKITMTESLINWDPISIDKAIKSKNENFSREKMLADLQDVLRNKDPRNLPNILELNGIKACKAIRNFEIVIGEYKELLGLKDLDRKFYPELERVRDEMIILKDNYITKEIITAVMSEVSSKKEGIFLIDMYKKIGVVEPLKELERELLDQFKAKKDLIGKLDDHDKMDKFKANLLKQLKTPKVTGHIAEAIKDLSVASVEIEEVSKKSVDPLGVASKPVEVVSHDPLKAFDMRRPPVNRHNHLKTSNIPRTH